MVLRSRRRKVFRLLLTTLVTSLFLYKFLPDRLANSDSILNQLTVSYLNKDGADFQKRRYDSTSTIDSKPPPRRNIIVVAHDRSGSTILGNMFNHHPSVFYLHEPMQTVERLVNTVHKSYATLMLDLLSDIFRCKFNKSVAEDLEYYYRDNSRSLGSQSIGSPPLCPYHVNDPIWDPTFCPRLTSELLSSVCQNNYAISAAKVLVRRLADKNVKSVMAACDRSAVDCKIIFLTRDPRPMSGSARSSSYFKNDEESLRRFSSQKCQQTKQNLAFIKSLTSPWRTRIMIQRYEDFAKNPLHVLSRLYAFAGLPELESVKTWLRNTTNSANSRAKLCKGREYGLCTVDDPSQAVQRWRWKMSVTDVNIIEDSCRDVMQMLGYNPVNGRQELLSNLSVSLTKEEYERMGVVSWLIFQGALTQIRSQKKGGRRS